MRLILRESEIAALIKNSVASMADELNSDEICVLFQTGKGGEILAEVGVYTPDALKGEDGWQFKPLPIEISKPDEDPDTLEED